MSGAHLDNDNVTLIREKVRLLDVVAKRVKLSQRGTNHYVGLCPFHSEKTPSFHVNCDNELFYCFGCGVHGDVIQFVSNIEGFDFKQAVEHLSQAYCIALPSHSTKPATSSLYELMECAAAWLTAQLHKSQVALSYLKCRRITDVTIKRFRLGYVPPSGLKAYLLSSNIALERIQDAGLVNKKGQDCLYNRIVFPIFGVTGKIISFGGRSINKNHTPKYLNAAENALFKKRDSLYGLYLALNSAKKLGKIIVVEGYIDVLILSQFGITNVVGLLGTAMTESHLKSMWNVAAEVIVWMDGDDAGMNASLKIACLAISIMQAGQSVSFVSPPAGKDPYDVCISDGIDSVKELINSARLLSEFIWEHELSRIVVRDKIKPEQCMILESRIKEYVSEIRDKSVLQHYKNFFYQQIKALQRSNTEWYSSIKNSDWKGKFSAHKNLALDRFKGVSLEVCAEESYQLRVLYTIIECPKLLDDTAVLEQFANLDFAESKRSLQQNIVDIKGSHCGELSKEDLIQKLRLRDSSLEKIVLALQQKMSRSGCTFVVGKGEELETLARREWDKLVLVRQLNEIREQIRQLQFEGRDDVALNLYEHEREIESKLRNLWKY